MQGGHIASSASSLHSHSFGCKSTALPTQFSTAFARKCLAHHVPSRSRAYCSVVQAAQIKPAYNKYRSRDDINESYVRQWKETTARDSQPRNLTPLTFLWFIPVFVKYHLTPGILRYAWWLVWTTLLAEEYKIRKRLVLQGAKLDVQLMKSGKTKNLTTFSKQLALQRLHHKVGFLDTLRYRIALFQGKDLHKFYLPPDQRANDQHDEVDDSTQDKDEYLNDLLPDLAVYVKEEQKEQNSTDGGAAGSQELQPVPA